MGKGPTVLILSEKNKLTDALTLQLISKGCEVYVGRSATFKRLESELGNKILFKVDFVINVSYSTFAANPSKSLTTNDFKRVLIARTIVHSLKIKGIFLFSYIQNKEFSEKTKSIVMSLFKKLPNYISIIFVGDLIDNFNNGILGSVLTKTIKTKKINLPQSFSFYPITCFDASFLVIKMMFSLTAFNARFAVLGRPVKVGNLKKTLFKNVYVKSEFFSKSVNLVLAEVDEIIYSKDKLKVNHFVKFLNKENPSQKTVTKKKLFFAVCALLTAPFICFLVGLILVNLSVTLLIKGQIKNSEHLARISYPFLSVPKSFGNHIAFFKKAAPYVRQSEALIKITSAAKSTYTVYNNLLNNRANSSENYQAITLSLQGAYENLSFVQSSPGFSKLQDLKNYVFKLLVFSRGLTEMLGEYSSKKYVVFIENPDFLMPGGGKIEKIYVISVYKGQITNTAFLDPEDGKKNIVGQISVPRSYPEFLKGDWYLGNANINYDFPTSAGQLMFFLEKQLNIEVDGVISLNTNLFSGAKIPKSVKDFYSKLPLIFSDLERNNIQMFFKNPSQEGAVVDLGWGGVVKKPECINDCYKDLLSVFELSLSDQSNIRRESNIQVNIEEKVIKRKITLYLENGGPFKYRTYLNFLVPENSGFSPVVILGNHVKEPNKVDTVAFKEFKILSFFMEVEPFKSKTAVFDWEGGFETNQDRLKEYTLLLGRQGGVVRHKTIVNIKTPGKEIYLPDPDFILTDMGGLMYNADLSNDKILRIHFK